MKLLILAIYSEGEEYREMLEIQRSYFHKYENVYSYMTTFRETQQNSVEIEGDFVFVRGKESYLGITQKTIESLEYLLQKHRDVDYIVRTNMSTIINIPELYQFCLALPKEKVYTSGIINQLEWLDEKGGITDQSLWGTRYASGTSILMSKDVAMYMIQKKKSIRHDVVDDVAIGLFMSNYLPDLCDFSTIASLYSVPQDFDIDMIDRNYIFFRNRSSVNRTEDVKNMKMICDVLYNTKESFENGITLFLDQCSSWYVYVGSSIGLFLFTIGYFIYSNRRRRKLRTF
jgi:hypothetical protein